MDTYINDVMDNSTMNVFKLFEKSRNNELLTFEATVVTGFEPCAMDEFLENFPNNDICAEAGRVFFNIKEEQYSTVEQLRSVDHISVVAAVLQNAKFSKANPDEDTNILQNFARSYNFSTSFEFWTKVTKFLGKTSPSKDEFDKVNDMIRNLKVEDKITPSALSPDNNLLRFRVTCRRSGIHSFTSNTAAHVYGGILNDKHLWVVDLDNYDLNIILNVAGDQVYAVFRITTISLHNRNISHFGPTTLRPTICYNLYRMAKPLSGEIILDPLCGTGSVSIEGSIAFPFTFNLSGDRCGNILSDKYNKNIRDLHTLHTNRLQPDIVRWDATNLPLRDGIIDAIVSDLPFGKRSGSYADNRILYKDLLLEFARVVQDKGRAILLTYDRRSMLTALRSCRHIWWEKSAKVINIGGLRGVVFVLQRTRAKS